VRALMEARRVARPGGLIAIAAISRFASLLDGLISGWLGDSSFDAIVERDLVDGQHRNPTGREEWFTTAFFHHPDELVAEIADAALETEGLFGVEGLGWILWDRLWDDAKGAREHPARGTGCGTGANVDRRQFTSLRGGAQAAVAGGAQGTFLYARPREVPATRESESLNSKPCLLCSAQFYAGDTTPPPMCPPCGPKVSPR
jgi:hypothetical protein